MAEAFMLPLWITDFKGFYETLLERIRYRRIPPVARLVLKHMVFVSCPKLEVTHPKMVGSMQVVGYGPKVLYCRADGVLIPLPYREVVLDDSWVKVMVPRLVEWNAGFEQDRDKAARDAIAAALKKPGYLFFGRFSPVSLESPVLGETFKKTRRMDAQLIWCVIEDVGLVIKAHLASEIAVVPLGRE